MTTQQTKVEHARLELLALRSAIMHPPLDDVSLTQDAALRIANAIWLLHAHPEAPTPSPELTARMVGAIRELAARDNGDGTVSLVGIQRTVQDAVEIAAELEPVDGDEAIANGLVGPFDIWGNRAAHEQAQQLALAAIKRGRKMEADERNAAIKRKWDDAHDPARRALAEAGK